MPPQVYHSLFYDDCLDAPLCITGVGAGMKNAEGEEDLPWDPAGHGAIATGSVTKCQEFGLFADFRPQPRGDEVDRGGLSPPVDYFPASEAGQ